MLPSVYLQLASYFVLWNIIFIFELNFVSYPYQQSETATVGFQFCLYTLNLITHMQIFTLDGLFLSCNLVSNQPVLNHSKRFFLKF